MPVSDATNGGHRWPRPSNDAERVAALHALGVLDTPEDVDLAAVTRVASYVCNVPTAVVNLIDEDRQWQAAAFGSERASVPRDDSMCAWSILQPGVTYTRDASHEQVFADNPFVDGRIASVRLYASAPVVIDSGFVVGSLCAFSERPGELSREQIDRLADLAAAAARILELRKGLGEMSEAAAKDPLTGLRNRAVFRDALRRSLGLYHDGLGRVGVLFLDLNGFKPVNDQYGHQAGDTVLVALAGRLGNSVRDSELVARMGGDEFAVLVQAADDTELDERMATIAARVAARLEEPVPVSDGVEVVVGAAVGRATAMPEDTPESLLARADAAMYAVKRPSIRADRSDAPS
jgi:diguanylate cyclase (GGDEF)-like protein